MRTRAHSPMIDSFAVPDFSCLPKISAPTVATFWAENHSPMAIEGRDSLSSPGESAAAAAAAAAFVESSETLCLGGALKFCPPATSSEKVTWCELDHCWSSGLLIPSRAGRLMMASLTVPVCNLDDQLKVWPPSRSHSQFKYSVSPHSLSRSHKLMR